MASSVNGNLEATTNYGDTAYFKWQLLASFVADSDGNARGIDNGHWELVDGTGDFASMRGVGRLLEFVDKTHRRYVVEGDISSPPSCLNKIGIVPRTLGSMYQATLDPKNHE